MGWAGEHLTREQRDTIARTLFAVTDVDGDWLVGVCPFHDDNSPSFTYSLKDDVYKCFASCCDSGDLIDLFCGVKGLSKKDGFRAFRRDYTSVIGSSGEVRQTPGQLVRKAARILSMSGEPVAAKGACAEIPESVLETLEEISPAMAKELWHRRGWLPDTLKEIGVKVLSHYRRKSDLYNLFPIKERDRVAIPVRDSAGILRNIRVYYPFGKPEAAPAKIMSWGKGHGSSMLLLPPRGLRPGTVILLEGEPDWICGLSQGLNVVTQTGKPDTWPKGHLEALKGRDIVLAFDADKPGQEYAQKAAKNLMRVGCRVFLLEWPDYMGRQQDGSWPDDHGQDLTDFFVKYGRSLAEFLVLVDNAVLCGSPQGEEGSGSAADDNAPSYLRFFEAGANGRVSFREKLLADYLISQHTMVYHDMSGQLYRWGEGMYEPWSVEQLKRGAIESLGDEATSSRVGAVASLIMSMVSMPQGRDLNDRRQWACLRNGMLDLLTLEFVPHDPDFMSTVKLGVSWHDACPPKPERWLSFLAETIQTPGPIAQLQEYFGYSLTRDTRFGKALLLLGPGSDGKSKVIKLLREIVGPQNCSAVPFSGLEDQFQRAALFNKMLNIGAEVTTDALQSEFFKAIVTGDSIQASFKHKDSFEFTPFCKLVYAMNKRPRVLDNSDGFFRRILPIQFKRQFLESDPAMDPDLEEKLMAELDGIFAWAVQGLHRLLQQKRFTVCDETLEFLLSYRRYNNPVMAFVQDCCALNDHAQADLKDLYKEYKKYCSEGGYKSLNRENFLEELKTATRKIKESSAVSCSRPRVGKDRPYLINGLCLSEGYGDGI